MRRSRCGVVLCCAVLCCDVIWCAVLWWRDGSGDNTYGCRLQPFGCKLQPLGCRLTSHQHEAYLTDVGVSGAYSG